MGDAGRHFCISDIHGDFEKYERMLALIDFRKEDVLFVIGDVVDRKQGGLRILRDMMMRDNVVPILGNHEYMAAICLNWLNQTISEESIASLHTDHLQRLQEWMEVGGASTLQEFYELDFEARFDILDYLSDFALYETLTLNHRHYILVHAGLYHFSMQRGLEDYDVSELIFHPMDYGRTYFPDAYIVSGHLPTRVIYAAKQGQELSELKPHEYRDEIYMENHHIAIDCGCGYDGRLGCICLDDLQHFYV